tara:strand:+ start:2482 stop:3303 length:822 start_codon:yes stop_codon:yes gene_type:complete
MGQEDDLLTRGMAGQAGSEGDAGNQLSGGSEGKPGESTSSATDQSGGDVPTFHDQFKADLKGHDSLMKFTNPSDLAAGYVDLEGRLGRAVVKPGENATAEEWSRFYSQLGRPEQQTGYALSEVGLPEGVTVSEENRAAFCGHAFELGLTRAQAQAIYKANAENVSDTIGSLKRVFQGQREAAVTKLKEDWPGDQYDTNMELASRAVKGLGSSDFVDFLRQSGLDRHPDMSRFCAKVGAAMAEGSFPAGEGRPAAEGGSFYDGIISDIYPDQEG